MAIGPNACQYHYHYSRITHINMFYAYLHSKCPMVIPKLAKLELQIMETLWKLKMSSIRQMREAFPDKDRPAYTSWSI
jgi:hypothetical protein